MSWLHDSLTSLPGADAAAGDAVRARAADILRPAGALARLDELAAWVAEWQGTPTPSVTRPAALIFAADHGVAAAGVSKYPIEVTGAMLAAFRSHQSTVTAFASVVGATVAAVDVGVGRPTGDIRVEAALSAERFEQCVAAGREAVDALDADLLVIGEMGIGNTTAAAAVAAALGDGPAGD
ncbi:MAG: nicotinate-nucleotide--dimethylbenzimidazole phosphoribosyltransferase [Ilumatobacteraceae bacterium]